MDGSARTGALKREVARLNSLASLQELQIESLRDNVSEAAKAAASASEAATASLLEERRIREVTERELQREKSITTLLTTERDTLALIVQRQQEIRRADLLDAQLEVALRMRGETAIRKQENALRSPE